MEHTIQHFLTSGPWPLTSDLDLWTWPRYPSTWHSSQNSTLYVCPFSRESETDGRTQTDRQCQNYYTRHVLDVGCNNFSHVTTYHRSTFSHDCTEPCFSLFVFLFLICQKTPMWLLQYYIQYCSNQIVQSDSRLNCNRFFTELQKIPPASGLQMLPISFMCILFFKNNLENCNFNLEWDI